MMGNKIQKAADFDTLSHEEKKKINGFTESQYNELKAKYGNRLRMVTVETEDGRHDYLIVRPSRAHMMLVAERGKDGDYEAANEVLIGNCVVAGDRDVLNGDYAVYSSVMQALQSLTEATQAFIRKA